MNEEIRKNEIREDELEHVNGGTGFTILPGISTTAREQQNKESKKIPTELNDDELEIVAGGLGVKVAINQFGVIKRLKGQN